MTFLDLKLNVKWNIDYWPFIYRLLEIGSYWGASFPLSVKKHTQFKNTKSQFIITHPQRQTLKNLAFTSPTFPHPNMPPTPDVLILALHWHSAPPSLECTFLVHSAHHSCHLPQESPTKSKRSSCALGCVTRGVGLKCKPVGDTAGRRPRNGYIPDDE